MHWDGKSLEGYKHVDKRIEKLAVVLTSTFETYEFPEKVLDICELFNSSADSCFMAIANVLENQTPKLKQLLLGEVFDSTALNRGGKNRVMVKLEEYIGRKLLHVYCSNHIFERICNGVLITVVGDSKAP